MNQSLSGWTKGARRTERTGAESAMHSEVGKHIATAPEVRHQNALQDQVFDNVGYQPDRFVPKFGGAYPWSSLFSSVLAGLVTFPIPDAFICWKKGTATKQAWREKIAIIFLFFFMVSGIFVASVSFGPHLGMHRVARVL